MYHFKLSDALRRAIVADLERPHVHAYERVGFIRTHQPVAASEMLILCREYLPVPDNYYIRDPWVGAKIDASAIREALEWADGWQGGIFHVHKHFGEGIPGFSPDDEVGNSRLIPAFFNIAPSGVHGAVVLSDDRLFGAAWDAKTSEPQVIQRYSIIGPRSTRWRL